MEDGNYYPFGLAMAGISSKALKGAAYVENKNKYNGKELQNKEFNDSAGLEWYDYGPRMYDQQIGRFISVDPLIQKFPWQSSYCAMDNNPILKNDPTGWRLHHHLRM